MTFDAHQLDSFLLVGSVVTLLAILAVRVSSRAGLPSLLNRSSIHAGGWRYSAS